MVWGANKRWFMRGPSNYFFLADVNQAEGERGERESEGGEGPHKSVASSRGPLRGVGCEFMRPLSRDPGAALYGPPRR